MAADAVDPVNSLRILPADAADAGAFANEIAFATAPLPGPLAIADLTAFEPAYSFSN